MELRYPVVSQMELGSGFNVPLSSRSGSESEEVGTTRGRRWGGALVGEAQDTTMEMMERSGPRAPPAFLRILSIDTCRRGGTAGP